MIAFIIVFVAGLGISFFLTPYIKDRLIERGFLDKPDARKVHTRAIPRLGGVAIYIGFFVSLIIAYFGYPRFFEEREMNILGLLVASTFIVIVGAVDDIYNIRPWIKLAAQIASAIILIIFGFNIEAISNPFGGAIELGALNYPLTVLWVIGVINAINLVDGLDGLASGVSLIVAMTIFLIGLYLDKSYVALLSFGLTGSILGFLRHNFYPAKIFMGDSGSMFIGLVLAALGLISSQKSAVSFAILVPFIALGYPVLDTALAIVRRAKAKRNIFTADREHIHHVLLSYGYSHQKTVIVLYVICLFFASMAFLFAAFNKSNKFIMGVLFFVGMFAFVFVRFLSYAKVPVDDDENTDDKKADSTSTASRNDKDD
ncbi:undecaprenyl/decaprenyl-phosphate alpha-N-acetylglucosaminyl 1-phosphate transferase [bacterium]|nr:undecaprenyl/decaprenyl-phosphate alpha-N-acetylglucosaminyl 1-phosphate transferase [bacterium]